MLQSYYFYLRNHGEAINLFMVFCFFCLCCSVPYSENSAGKKCYFFNADNQELFARNQFSKTENVKYLLGLKNSTTPITLISLGFSLCTEYS